MYKVTSQVVVSAVHREKENRLTKENEDASSIESFKFRLVGMYWLFALAALALGIIWRKGPLYKLIDFLSASAHEFATEYNSVYAVEEKEK